MAAGFAASISVNLSGRPVARSQNMLMLQQMMKACTAGGSSLAVQTASLQRRHGWFDVPSVSVMCRGKAESRKWQRDGFNGLCLCTCVPLHRIRVVKLCAMSAAPRAPRCASLEWRTTYGWSAWCVRIAPDAFAEGAMAIAGARCKAVCIFVYRFWKVFLPPHLDAQLTTPLYSVDHARTIGQRVELEGSTCWVLCTHVRCVCVASAIAEACSCGRLRTSSQRH